MTSVLIRGGNLGTDSHAQGGCRVKPESAHLLAKETSLKHCPSQPSEGTNPTLQSSSLQNWETLHFHYLSHSWHQQTNAQCEQSGMTTKSQRLILGPTCLARPCLPPHASQLCCSPTPPRSVRASSSPLCSSEAVSTACSRWPGPPRLTHCQLGVAWFGHIPIWIPSCLSHSLASTALCPRFSSPQPYLCLQHSAV